MTDSTQSIIIRWPDSQRIMEHPKARAVDDDDYPNSYCIPNDIWEKYKYSYYEADSSSEGLDETDYCIDCGDSKTLDDLTYCAYCSQCVCDKCYIIWGRDISCNACKKND